jgi:aminoglycoside 3-N-acetyltransferase
MTNTLKNRWAKSGIKKNDNILLHSSFKRTFYELNQQKYKVTPLDILHSFIDLIGPDGTLVIPTFNFQFNNGIPYNYYLTKSHMGIVTEFARTHPEAKRTHNPVYSFAVFGKKSHLFSDIDNVSWYGSDSPFALMHKLNFNICIIDLEDRYSMTFAHYCEEYHKAPWRYYKKFTSQYTDKNNNTTTKTYLGYVRNLDKNIVSTLNPAADLLWEKKLYKGNRPFINNGLRFISSKNYFNFFSKLYEQKKCRFFYYDIKK